MIFVLSPAKALDYESPLSTPRFSEPDYLDDAACLIEGLRELSPAEVARLMDLSDSLAALNVARYAEWSQPFTPDNARPAMLAFNGDVYDGLDARAFSEADLEYAQRHLRILSGLYGLLKPLDLMQPYRLEMGTRFANPRGKDLYAFWGMTQTDALNRLLVAEVEAGREAVLVNLASEEYFKSIKTGRLTGRLLNIGFEDWKGGRYKIISFYAKRARGMMARYAITGRLQDVEQLKAFSADGYAFAAEASDDGRWVFRRRQG
ncbi:peroxide stress protein YaaA [Zoogloea sp.]|uniref:peroxide stress protein YaaA n=1 Tax=Zoogloea sp. TaxID=49181 RepID=UPI001AC92BF9|nr:peroxide stress protein YaaA [Zoogloea sp.]MBN8282907.1 peroxide stress protein YaaA [Zoogloea sp.]